MNMRRRHQRQEINEQQRKELKKIDPHELSLRRLLTQKKKIDGIFDDIGLYRWVGGMNTAMEDCRTDWEKKLQLRLQKKLKLKPGHKDFLHA